MVATEFTEAKQKLIASLTTVMVVFTLLLPRLSRCLKRINRVVQGA